jgi:anti-sigma B factor antagonist
MDIRIDERKIGIVTVLDIVGRLTMVEASQAFKTKIESLVVREHTRIVVNLEGVPYIDSSGLGQLVASYGAVRRTGGALKLLNVSSRNRDLLFITRLGTLFQSFDSEADAVRSFQPAAAPGLESGRSEDVPRRDV